MHCPPPAPATATSAAGTSAAGDRQEKGEQAEAAAAASDQGHLHRPSHRLAPVIGGEADGADKSGHIKAPHLRSTSISCSRWPSVILRITSSMPKLAAFIRGGNWAKLCSHFET